VHEDDHPANVVADRGALVGEAGWRMARPQEVVLVRHGETEWSASGRHTGTTDVALTDPGRADGAGLGPALAAWRFALVLTSPLARATETCRLAGLEGRAEVDDRLREWDYGAYEGRTTAEIRVDDPGWTVWRGPIPGGETIAQVAARADAVIARIEAADGDVAVFSHGHLLRVLAVRWLGLDPIEGRGLMLDTATLSVLSTEREHHAIRVWNSAVLPSA
jgi:probable phosphoglycerate mutase